MRSCSRDLNRWLLSWFFWTPESSFVDFYVIFLLLIVNVHMVSCFLIVTRDSVHFRLVSWFGLHGTGVWLISVFRECDSKRIKMLLCSNLPRLHVSNLPEYLSWCLKRSQSHLKLLFVFFLVALLISLIDLLLAFTLDERVRHALVIGLPKIDTWFLVGLKGFDHSILQIRMWNILVFHAYSMTWHVPRKNLTTHLPQSQNVGWKLPVIYFNWLNNQGWILVSDCGWHVLWSCPNWNLR